MSRAQMQQADENRNKTNQIEREKKDQGSNDRAQKQYQNTEDKNKTDRIEDRKRGR